MHDLNFNKCFMCNKDCSNKVNIVLIHITGAPSSESITYCQECFKSIAPQNLIDAMKWPGEYKEDEYPTTSVGQSINFRNNPTMPIQLQHPGFISIEYLCYIGKPPISMTHIHCSACNHVIANANMITCGLDQLTEFCIVMKGKKDYICFHCHANVNWVYYE
jgi:hypothetical protein